MRIKVETSRYHLRTHEAVFDIEVRSIVFDGRVKAGEESEFIERIISFFVLKILF